MNETIKLLFGDDAITFEEFCERLDGLSPNEVFIDRAEYDLLADSYDALKEKTKNFDPDWEKKARKIIFDGALDSALSLTNVRNKDIIKTLLDYETLEYDSGDIKGLDEQLENLKEEHDYLFESTVPTIAFGRSVGGALKKENETKNSQTNSVLRAVFNRK